MPQIKIAIVDDHPLFRKGVIKLLDANRYELLFDATDGLSLIEKMKSHAPVEPDIVIMDIVMRGMNGFETVAWIKSNYPGIEILVLSVEDNEEAVVRMLKLGVKGYLSKEMEPEELHAALAAITAGNYYFTDIVTNRLVHAIQQDDNDPENKGEFVSSHEQWNSLNDRQKEFLRYACTEMIYEEIARVMCVSAKTIDGYRDVVFDRLKVKSRVGLVLYAIRNKLVTI